MKTKKKSACKPEIILKQLFKHHKLLTNENLMHKHHEIFKIINSQICTPVYIFNTSSSGDFSMNNMLVSNIHFLLVKNKY